MAKRATFLAVVICAIWCWPACAQDSLTIWREFVSSLKSGAMTVERIRPYEGLSAETLLGWLNIIAKEVPVESLSVTPEAHHVGDQFQYLIPIGEATFCFTFLLDGETWYFRHLENIFIRLDKIDSLPTSRFPDVSEEQKAWAREEIYWSQQVYFFSFLVKEKGKDLALNRFKDGRGYFLAAKTWVPFVPALRAFVLYACWEQANLRGNTVVLERLDDTEAVIRFPRILYFEIYKHAGHLKQQITFEDYRRIFETIWQDRATSSGWDLQLAYEPNGECVFRLTRR